MDKAAFYGDVTIPDNTSFKQNTEFVKTWQIKNEDTCTWDGHKLVFGGGSIMNAPLANPMPVVKPGEFANISVNLTSPNHGGLYTGLWNFENKEGKHFGVNSGGVGFILRCRWFGDKINLSLLTERKLAWEQIKRCVLA